MSEIESKIRAMIIAYEGHEEDAAEEILIFMRSRVVTPEELETGAKAELHEYCPGVGSWEKASAAQRRVTKAAFAAGLRAIGLRVES